MGGQLLKGQTDYNYIYVNVIQIHCFNTNEHAAALAVGVWLKAAKRFDLQQIFIQPVIHTCNRSIRLVNVCYC